MQRSEEYLKELDNAVDSLIRLANEARSKGYDVALQVESEKANTLPERVVALFGYPNIGERISYWLSKGLGKRELAFKIADEILAGDMGLDLGPAEKAELAVRVGLSIMTGATVSAPVEGINKVIIRRNPDDGSNYLSIYFNGPIRTSGGTDGALVVVLADYLRQKMGLAPYKPGPREIGRYIEEVSLYKRVQHLQYNSRSEEVRYVAEHLPVEINGPPTEKIEVSAYRNLRTVETNRLRGGAILVLNDCILQKAPKLLMAIKRLREKGYDIKGWDWLEWFQTKSEKEQVGEGCPYISPSYKFLRESVAGRPVLSHPQRPVGFRLRYGRSRVTGLASVGIHPATMYILDEFIATGSQLKLERPGKAAAVTPCDLIEGPVVRLKGGTVIRVNTGEEARRIKDKVEKVLFLGDILISYGDFVEQNHILLPSGWVEEWWVQELEKVLEERGLSKEDFRDILENPFKEIEARRAIDISLKLGLPLHPRYTYHWNYLGVEDFKYLYSKLKGRRIEFPLVLEMDEKFKEILEKICIPHKVERNSIIIEENEALPFLYSLGILPKFEEEKLKALEDFRDPLEFLNKVSVLKLRNKIPFTVGARLGRPEKAKMRRLKTRPHMLFPLGSQGGRMRSLNEALKKGYVEVEVPIFFCPKCNSKRMYRICRVCGSRTQPYRVCQNCGKYTRKKIHCGAKTKPFEKRKVDIKLLTSIATKGLGVKLPPLVKGVKGTSSKGKIAEPIEKGILRAKNRVYVNKDGTIRFDCIEVPITHFRPKEIGLSVEEVKALGYKYDIFGNEIESEDQLVELFPQDIILPDCKEWGEASAAEDLMRVAKFIDELLVKFYKKKPYYQVRKKKDLIGKLVVGLAPHTSVGVVGRIIGFSKTQGYFAHPLFHAAMRRNCDGDESCIILLMDAFLNFSREYLPQKRGGSMDAPLVLTTKIILTEVDKEVYNLDIVDRYPLEFYEKSQEFASPTSVRIPRLMEKVNKNEYLGLKFTHDVSNLNIGVRVSAYKKLITMKEKIERQMKLAEKIVAVDKNDVARILIEKHFLKDIKGNLREFSKQKFRCVNCNEKYRRIPLSGKCEKCGGRIILTVAEGMVYKYLETCERLASSYELPPYLLQALEIIKRRINSVFGKGRQMLLNSYGK